MPADANRYFFDEYIQRGRVHGEGSGRRVAIAWPRGVLENQLNRSLKNLGASCIDVYYLHNPETQLGEIPRPGLFESRCAKRLSFWNRAVAAGRKIKFYGMATWNGFRQEAKAADSLFLSELEKIARDLAGDAHHFRFVQLPYNPGNDRKH